MHEFTHNRNAGHAGLREVGGVGGVHVTDRHDRNRRFCYQFGVALQADGWAPGILRWCGPEGAGPHIIQAVREFGRPAHQVQGAGGQANDGVWSQDFPGEVWAQVILADVDPVDVVFSHEGGCDVDAVVDKHPGAGVCLLDCGGDANSQVSEFAHCDRFAANLHHASATGRRLGSDAGDLFEFAASVRQASGHEVTAQVHVMH